MPESLKVNGILANFVKVGELSAIINRSKISIYKMEEKKILPPPNFKLRNKDRLYTVELANELKEIFIVEVSQGTKISDETKNKILAVFRKEKLRFTPPKK